MRKTIWIVPILLCVASLIGLFRPFGKVTFDKSVSENRILFQYEIFGCGSLIGKVLDGGEELVSGYVGDYPDIGTNEVVFSEDSDEPRKHMDNGEFFNAGLAERYTYIIEGTPVGVTRGAPECCDPKPAYNEKVVEFKVDKWYFTEYVPYIEIGDYLVIIWLSIAVLVCAFWLLVLFVAVLVKKKKQNNI